MNEKDKPKELCGDDFSDWENLDLATADFQAKSTPIGEDLTTKAITRADSSIDKASEDQLTQLSPYARVAGLYAWTTDFLNTLSATGDKTEAARRAGVSRTMVHRLMANDPEFAELVNEQMLQWRSWLLEQGRKQIEKGNWRAIEKYLEAYIPEFAPPGMNLQVNVGQPIIVDLVSKDKDDLDSL